MYIVIEYTRYGMLKNPRGNPSEWKEWNSILGTNRPYGGEWEFPPLRGNVEKFKTLQEKKTVWTKYGIIIMKNRDSRLRNFGTLPLKVIYPSGSQILPKLDELIGQGVSFTRASDFVKGELKQHYTPSPRQNSIYAEMVRKESSAVFTHSGMLAVWNAISDIGGSNSWEYKYYIVEDTEKALIPHLVRMKLLATNTNMRPL